jgi:putative acetyltransferase
MDEKLTIREVKPEDNFQLAKIIRDVFEEYHTPKSGTVYSDPTTDNLFQMFRARQSILWIAELDNQVIGSCGIYPTEGLSEDMVELVKFYLSPSSRRKGVGKKLIEQTIQSALDFGYKRLYLESFPEFSKAIHMYEKLGFKRIDHSQGNTGHTSCCVWMIKEL